MAPARGGVARTLEELFGEVRISSTTPQDRKSVDSPTCGRRDAAFPQGPSRREHPAAYAYEHPFAARAGRWSAANRKKAIFGWLAFVIAAVAIGAAVGTKTPANDNSYVGDSGRGDKLVTDHYPDTAGESVLIQGRDGQTYRDADVRAAVDQTVKAVSGFKHRRERRLALRQGQPRPDQPRRQVRPRELRDQGRRRRDQERDRPDRGRRRQGRRRPSRRSASASSATPARARRIEKSFNDDFAKAETLSVPITIVDPDPRVRHARRRRHPDPAGADRGLRHARHPRSRSATWSRSRPERQLGRAADRDGGRRGLHALLPQARARGTASGRSPSARRSTPPRRRRAAPSWSRA